MTTCLPAHRARWHKVHGVLRLPTACGRYVADEGELAALGAKPTCLGCRAAVINVSIALIRGTKDAVLPWAGIGNFRERREPLNEREKRLPAVVPRPKPRELPTPPKCRTCGNNEHMQPLYSSPGWMRTTTFPERHVIYVRPKTVFDRRHRKSARYASTLVAWHCNAEHSPVRDTLFFVRRKRGALRRDQPVEVDE